VTTFKALSRTLLSLYLELSHGKREFAKEEKIFLPLSASFWPNCICLSCLDISYKSVVNKVLTRPFMTSQQASGGKRQEFAEKQKSLRSECPQKSQNNEIKKESLTDGSQKRKSVGLL